MTDKQKQVDVRGWAYNHPKSAEMFLEQVIALAKEGYVINPRPVSAAKRPTLIGFPFVSMVTPEYAEELIGKAKIAEIAKIESDIKAEIENLKGKDEMVAFAEKHNLEIPEDKKVPKAIQKWLSDQF